MSLKLFWLFYIYNSLFKLAQAQRLKKICHYSFLLNEPQIIVLSVNSFVGSRFKGQKNDRTLIFCYKNPVEVVHD